MKLNKIFAALMAVAVLAMFGSCKNEGTDVIKLKGSKITLTVGQSYTIGVQEHSGAITWASSNEAVATVNAEGTVTAVAVGSAAVTATVGKAKATMDVTVEEGGQTGGAPDLEAPAEGTLRVVLEIPAGSECNGIALKGTFDGSEWSGENTYLGADGAATPVDGAIYKFAPVEGYENWFSVDVPASDAMEFKVCLIFAGDGSWQGQAVNVALHSCNYSSVVPEISGDGQCKAMGANGGLLYLSIGGWQNSECAVLSDYKVTVLVPAFCDGEFNIELVGSFEGWGSAPVALVKEAEGKYTATIQAAPNAEIKVRGEGGWDKEIQIFETSEEKPEGEWKGVSNYVLSEELNVTMDYSNAELYRWNVCGAVEPIEPTGEVWIKCASNGWTWEQMTETNGVFTYEATVADASNIGANIGLDANGSGEKWYDLGDMSAAAHGLAEGDAYVYTFTQAEGTEGTLEVAKK
jgi:hypothetical protein